MSETFCPCCGAAEPDWNGSRSDPEWLDQPAEIARQRELRDWQEPRPNTSMDCRVKRFGGVKAMFLPDALDYSSPFVRFWRRVGRWFLSDRVKSRRRARRHKEWLQEMDEINRLKKC